ncbi:MAG: helix-hairpin-helix domain-containing protein [Bacilli bacterium]|nr:helix-hairpin-helix domain-containing protein [Bacilli bacterium]
MKTIIIIIAITLIGLVGAGVVSKTVSNGGNWTSTTSSEEAANTITVSVSGEVNRPGSYVLEEGATMYDLLQAASGTNTNADSLAYDSTCVLTEKSYYIAPIFDNSNSCAVDPISKVNINTADADSLNSIAGFSKTVSAAIVAYRGSNSYTFSYIEQIQEVSGIGPATFLAVRDKITLRSAY